MTETTWWKIIGIAAIGAGLIMLGSYFGFEAFLLGVLTMLGGMTIGAEVAIEEYDKTE